MLEFFGVEDGAERTHQVCTNSELEAVLEDDKFSNPKGIQVSTFSLAAPPFLLER